MWYRNPSWYWTILLVFGFASQALAVEIWTPPDWIPKLLGAEFDKNGNQIEDLLEPGAGSDRVTVLLALNRCPNAGDRDRLGTFGVFVYESETLSAVVLTSVVRSSLARLAADPLVAMVEADHLNFPMVDVSRGHLLISPSPDYSPNTVVEQAPGITGTNVNIAILDSGVDDGLHASLPAWKFVAGYDAISKTTGNPADSNGHGTMLAGIAVGTGGASPTMAGMAPGAGIIDINVVPSTGRFAADSVVIQALDFCVKNRQRHKIGVLLFGYVNTQANSNGKGVLARAFDNAAAQGMVVVVPVGNTGTPLTNYPANFNRIGVPASANLALVVGASDHRRTVSRTGAVVAPFSLSGPRLDNQDGDPANELKPDVVAPGVGINVAQRGTQRGYFQTNGTSLAAAQVAGLAALILQQKPQFTEREVREVIVRSAEDFGPPGWDPNWGHGLVNAFGALGLTPKPGITNTPPIAFTNGVTDIGFKFHSGIGGSGPYSPDLIPIDPNVAANKTNVIQATVYNFGSNGATNIQIVLSASVFGNSVIPNPICTLGIPGPLAPGSEIKVTCTWVPSAAYIGSHACFHGSLVFPGDSDPGNNYAQHNIGVIASASPARLFARVVNPLETDAWVYLEDDFPENSPWRLQVNPRQFLMSASGCPEEVEILVIPPEPPPQNLPEQTINFRVMARSEELAEPVSIGGFRVVAFVKAGNQPPRTSDDCFVFHPDVSLIIGAQEGVLANDSDPEGKPISSVLMSAPRHGTVSLFADGSFRYEPSASAAVEDQFTYQATDGRSERSQLTTVRLTAAPKLRIENASAGRVKIDWANSPIECANLSLQHSPNLSAGWTSFAGTPVNIEGRSTVQVSAVGFSRYFRLGSRNPSSCLPPSAALRYFFSFDNSLWDLAGTLEAAVRPGASFVTARFSEGLRFDGDTVAFFPGATFGGIPSLSFWARTSSAEQGIASGGQSFKTWGIGIGSKGQVQLFHWNNAYSDGYALAEGNVSISDGRFHHIATASDSANGELRIYVDGKLDGYFRETRPGPHNFAGSLAGEAEFGRFNTQLLPQRSFVGEVDEVAIFSRPLQGEEVTSIYRSASFCIPLALLPQNAAAWWPFGDAAEESSLDLISGGAARIQGARIAPGRVGVARWFSPGDSLTFTGSRVDIGGPEVSIEGWFLFEPAPDSRQRFTATIGKHGSPDLSQQAYQLTFETGEHLGLSQTEYQVEYIFTDNSRTRDHNQSTGVVVPANGVFYHVAITYSSGRVRIYLNGVRWREFESRARGNLLSLPNVPLTLEGQTAFKVDELAIYQRELEPAEVLRIFQAGRAGKQR